MRKQDLNTTDVFTDVCRYDGDLIILEIGDWKHNRYSGPERGGSDSLVLNIDPELRHIPAEPVDAQGNDVDGELVDWFAVAARVREEIVGMARIQSNYEKSANYYKPPYGHLSVLSSRSITTRAIKEADALADQRLRKAQQDRREAERTARRNRFQTALDAAGFDAEDSFLPRLSGDSDDMRLTLAQFEEILARANK